MFKVHIAIKLSSENVRYWNLYKTQNKELKLLKIEFADLFFNCSFNCSNMSQRNANTTTNIFVHDVNVLQKKYIFTENVIKINNEYISQYIHVIKINKQYIEKYTDY